MHYCVSRFDHKFRCDFPRKGTLAQLCSLEAVAEAVAHAGPPPQVLDG